MRYFFVESIFLTREDAVQVKDPASLYVVAACFGQQHVCVPSLIFISKWL